MLKMNTFSRLAVLSITVVCVLTACSTMPGKSQPPANAVAIRDGAPPFPVDVSHIPDAVPQYEIKSSYGNPSMYTVEGKHYYVMDSAKGYSKVGVASWYGTKFHGKLTSSHEPYDMLAMTAASPTLPIPTYVRVTNLENGRQVVVKVNDRGPFANERIMDLSYAAAKKLGYAEKGTAKVKVEAITLETPHKIQNIYLQVGAFTQIAKAEQVKIKVAQLTHQSARIAPLNRPNQVLYRVQIGPVSAPEKSNIVDSLQQQGFSHPIVILS